MAISRTLTLALLVMVAVPGCGGATGGATTPGAPSDDAPGGAELWGLHCGRCHNTRSPTVASDAEWDVIALHMRIRAQLTPDDTTAILQFLRSGN